MFGYCTSLKNIEGLEDWNVSTNCTTLNSMFDYCGSLFCDKEILNLNKWNVSNATLLSFMFRECRSLKNISLSSWDVRKVTGMGAMFEFCDSLQYLDISNWQPIVTTTNNNFLFNSNSIKSLKMPSLTAINSTLQFFAAGCTSLSMITFSTSGMNVGSGGILGFSSCNFSSASLNYIYQNLATNGSGKTINVTDNYGVDGDNPTIATNKGWTVTG
jgi:surface protein